MKNYTEQGTRWRTKPTRWVDMDTGEEITKWRAQKYYVIIQTDKHVEFNYNNTEGTIEYTKQCSRNGKQQRLHDDW